MGALALLGIGPSEARRMPAHVAARVVGAAAESRLEVAAFLDAARGSDGSLPLDLYEEEPAPKPAPARRRRFKRGLGPGAKRLG